MMIKATKHDIEAWLRTVATGEFHYKEILDGQIDPSSYGNLRKVISELCKGDTPLLEPIGKHDGHYRIIQNGEGPVDFANVHRRKDFPIVFPFDLRKYVFIYPDTTTVVAGSKSSGKTGFIYRTIAMNKDKMNVVLLSNMEGGAVQMYDRFLAMGIDLATMPKFVYQVSDNFHDYIKKPNTLYAIDYIDVPDGVEFYVVGAKIAKVDRKLQGLNSMALIGLQKPVNRDTAFGGEQTLKVASLYIAMDNSRLKIVDAKVPADKKLHPKNMQWTFHYDNEGTDFVNIQRSYSGTE